MKTVLLFLLILAVVAAGVFGFLMLTTPKTGKGVHFPLTANEQVLLSYVPGDAEVFAIVPTATVTYQKLRSNPITRESIEQWSAKHQMPGAWMLGGADLVLWKRGDETSYAIRIDPVRAMLVRIYLMIGGDSNGRADTNFRINAASSSPMGAADVAEITALAAGLPAGDLLIVQKSSGRGSFPPMARPAISSIAVTNSDVTFVSHAVAPDTLVSPQSLKASFVRGALMTAWFAKPPRVVDDLNRLFGARVSALVSDGGSLALYDIDTGTLLPRPKGVFVLPADDRRREAVRSLDSIAPQAVREAFGVKIHTAERASELLVSFDDSSIPLYSNDTPVAAFWPANRWALRMDAKRLVPILEGLGDNRGLRIAAPRLYRTARDVSHWVGFLREARSIEAADSSTGNMEEMHVRISN